MIKMIDKKSSIPLYHQLEEILKDKIMLNEMKHPGGDCDITEPVRIKINGPDFA